MFVALLLFCTSAIGAIDPEAHMSPRQIIQYNGYPEEEHWVTTTDGFILNMQRIPYGRQPDAAETSKPVFFLQHGLLGSSTNFLTNSRDQSLAFLLADAGFDVWLGNVRGDTYSTNHTYLKPQDAEFWAWSWDEMVRYDLPAMIEYVVNQTGQSQIYYVGHSQGTLIAFTGFSNNLQLAARIKAFYALAPVVKVGYIKGLTHYIAYLTPEIRDLFDIFGYHDFLPSTEFLRLFGETFCDIKKYGEEVCANCLFLVTGFDKPHLNLSRVSIYTSHNPAGTSVQNMVHYAQCHRANSYQMFDYGSSEENEAHYGQATPPMYDLANLRVPTYTYTGTNDWLADPTDVEWLLGRLSSLGVLKRQITIEGYEHLDFIWGNNVATDVYMSIINNAKER
ncbi:lysosomal acid lipase/cholesteryl ester hydrolase-like [Oscarella lobularis]|uniref:lysosomal acid lipase/cholesteryl ester hydrolase-like n=1 Tax=Oscarella lobularis TaxID=121494 RepID=UPI003313DDD8